MQRRRAMAMVLRVETKSKSCPHETLHCRKALIAAPNHVPSQSLHPASSAATSSHPSPTLPQFLRQSNHHCTDMAGPVMPMAMANANANAGAHPSIARLVRAARAGESPCSFSTDRTPADLSLGPATLLETGTTIPRPTQRPDGHHVARLVHGHLSHL